MKVCDTKTFDGECDLKIKYTGHNIPHYPWAIQVGAINYASSPNSTNQRASKQASRQTPKQALNRGKSK